MCSAIEKYYSPKPHLVSYSDAVSVLFFYLPNPFLSQWDFIDVCVIPFKKAKMRGKNIILKLLRDFLF